MDPKALRTFGDDASSAGSTKETKEANPMESISSTALKEQLDDDPTLGKIGVAHKKGSGVGMFASSKWKQKLLCVVGGGAMYYDDIKLSAKSTCSRYACCLFSLALFFSFFVFSFFPPASIAATLPRPFSNVSSAIELHTLTSRYLDLGGAYAEAVTDEKSPSEAPFAFRVVAPARTFIFACGTEEELASWLSVLAREIENKNEIDAHTVGTNDAASASGGSAAAAAPPPKKVVAL